MWLIKISENMRTRLVQEIYFVVQYMQNVKKENEK